MGAGHWAGCAPEVLLFTGHSESMRYDYEQKEGREHCEMEAARTELEAAHELPYSYPVDVWAAGCMAIELASGGQALASDCSADLLFQQFRLRGTPDERTWPGIDRLAKASFGMPAAEWPQYRPKVLSEEYPDLTPDAAELLGDMLCLNPAQRISAADALLHPFFDGLDKHHLGSAPLPEMARHGDIYALGTDGEQVDDEGG